MSSHLAEESVESGGDEKPFQDAKLAFQNHGLGETTNNFSDAKDDHSPVAGAKQHKGSLETIPESKADPNYEDEAKSSHNFSTKRCTLTCCAPDGSPLQGKSFIIGTDGASMGRKHTNAIALFMKVIQLVPTISSSNPAVLPHQILDPNTNEEKIATVDTAISSEHARVEFDSKLGELLQLLMFESIL